MIEKITMMDNIIGIILTLSVYAISRIFFIEKHGSYPNNKRRRKVIQPDQEADAMMHGLKFAIWTIIIWFLLFVAIPFVLHLPNHKP